MKGLLLKDWYMLKKYCRSYLFIIVLFLGVSQMDSGNTFFVMYPMVLLGLLPTTLISYDERSKWDVYCGTLPYTKDQQVTGKYLFLLLLLGGGYVLTSLVQLGQMFFRGAFSLQEFLLLESMSLSLGVLCPALMMPIVFWLGSEKGRMMYFVTIIVACAVAFSIGALREEGASAVVRVMQSPFAPVLIILVCLGILALSWQISLVLYRKREL